MARLAAGRVQYRQQVMRLEESSQEPCRSIMQCHVPGEAVAADEIAGFKRIASLWSCKCRRQTNRVEEKNFPEQLVGQDFIHSFISGKQGWSPRLALVRHCILCNLESIDTKAYIEQSPESIVFICHSMLNNIKANSGRR